MDLLFLSAGVILLGSSLAWTKPNTDWIKAGVVAQSKLPGNKSMAYEFNVNTPAYLGAAEEPMRLNGSYMENLRAKALYETSVNPKVTPWTKLIISNQWGSGSTSTGHRDPIIMENI